MALAIFDLDNTLLGGDSDLSWGEFLCQHNYVDASEYDRLNQLFYQQYEAGTMNISDFLRFALTPLAANDMETLAHWHNQFMQERIEPIMLPGAATLLEKHRQAGDFLLIITATNRFVTQPIADRLGVDAMLATEPEMKDGRYTGEVAGIPCYQAGKVTRLHAWLTENPQHSLEGAFFYSDSHNDLPLLELVAHPHAVHPDPKLQAHAEQHGWPVLDLR
ncbi:MAG: HAD-IB family hydrolase [Marinobacterium sp.]|nr:HAD-IB family hydrolase [Marinobacterium sp.]